MPYFGNLTDPWIHLEKQNFKFSSAHMTVFPDGTKESLHGHNYSVELSIELKQPSIQEMVPFSFFKRSIQEICQEWDEKVLLAGKCPYLKIKNFDLREIEFLLCEKRYILPSEDVVLLSIDNVTVEALTQEFCRQFLGKFEFTFLSKKISSVEVRVNEMLGQGASCLWQGSMLSSDVL